MSKNTPVKRGEVSAIDGATNRYRVKFPDEDGVVSFWLDGPAAGGTGRKGRSAMFAVGDQVWCLVDWDGEDGCVVQAANNDRDKAPSTAAENDHATYQDGAIDEHDPVTKVRRTVLHDDGELYLAVGPARLKITKAGIISSVPIALGTVDMPARRGGAG